MPRLITVVSPKSFPHLPISVILFPRKRIRPVFIGSFSKTAIRCGVCSGIKGIVSKRRWFVMLVWPATRNGKKQEVTDNHLITCMGEPFENLNRQINRKRHLLKSITLTAGFYRSQSLNHSGIFYPLCFMNCQIILPTCLERLFFLLLDVKSRNLPFNDC